MAETTIAKREDGTSMELCMRSEPSILPEIWQVWGSTALQALLVHCCCLIRRQRRVGAAVQLAAPVGHAGQPPAVPAVSHNHHMLLRVHRSMIILCMLSFAMFVRLRSLGANTMHHVPPRVSWKLVHPHAYNNLQC